MDFLICYEHIVREIENDTLLKYELEKRGYSCKIIHFNDMDYCLHTTKDKAKVVVTPWLRYDSNVYHYLRYARKPYKLVNLQWEQVYSEFGIKSGLTQTDGQALKAQHMCWGENSRKRLIDQGVHEEDAVTLGAIQMDYGRPLFDDYYLSKESLAEQYGLDGKKRWNLLISSFAYANYGEESIKNLERSFGCSLTQLVENHKTSQRLTLDWVEKLLETSDCEFVYRPHPSEKLDLRLNAMVKKYPHFHIISDYSVKQWAKVCDKVNLWISTSNAELLSMGVDYAIVRPVEIPYDYEVESMRNEDFITDCDGFLRYNTTYSENSASQIAEKLERIGQYYSYDPDYPAYKRVADYLEGVLKSEKGQRFCFTLKQRLTFGVKEFKNYIISVITRRCYLKQNVNFTKSFPLKKAIKRNIVLAIEKRNNKETVENKMLDYLVTHNGE